MGAGEIGQHLRELVAFVENLSSVPRNNVGHLTTICNSSSKGLMPSAGLTGTCTHMHTLSQIDKEFKIRTFTACV